MAEKEDEIGRKEEDEELAKLLDKSLGEFGQHKAKRCSDDELDNLMQGMDRQAAQKAARDFENMLRQLAEVQKVAMETKTDGDEDKAQDLVEGIQQLAARSSRVANAQSPEEFMDSLNALQNPDDDDAQLMPFLAGFMSTFLSKEMMYPPVKEIVDKYPQFLEEKRSSLDRDTLTRYERQLDVMQKICVEYEKEEIDPGDEEANKAQLDRITGLMQQMQMTGYPPEELVGALPSGWSFDADSGVPKLDNVQQATENCVLM